MKNRVKVKVKDLIEGILNDEIKYKKVEYNDMIYEYNEDEREYMHEDKGYSIYYEYLFDVIHDKENNLVDVYNTDVIVIENKKIEKLGLTYLKDDDKNEIIDKINEIIDNLNEGE